MQLIVCKQLVMCKRCVQNWAGIGDKMKGFLEESFNHAIMRDMMTQDEEGMFYLFCYEQGVCGFDDVMRVFIVDELTESIMDDLRAIYNQTLM